MMKKTSKLVALLLTSSMFLAACNNNQDANTKEDTKVESTEKAAKESNSQLDDKTVAMVNGEKLSKDDYKKEISFLYKEFLNSEKGIVEGIIYTPYPVAKEILKQIITAIEKRYQIKLHAKNEVEPDLIGGFKVVFGDKVLDRSVKRELEELYRKMVS